MCEAEYAERSATPFYEIFAEAFDLADPNLWKSNSFAAIRPRFMIELRAAIASLEYEIQRWRTEYRCKPEPEAQRKLARAREILALLDDGSAP